MEYQVFIGKGQDPQQAAAQATSQETSYRSSQDLVLLKVNGQTLYTSHTEWYYILTVTYQRRSGVIDPHQREVY